MYPLRKYTIGLFSHQQVTYWWMLIIWNRLVELQQTYGRKNLWHNQYVLYEFYSHRKPKSFLNHHEAASTEILEDTIDFVCYLISIFSVLSKFILKLHGKKLFDCIVVFSRNLNNFSQPSNNNDLQSHCQQETFHCRGFLMTSLDCKAKLDF